MSRIANAGAELCRWLQTLPRGLCWPWVLPAVLAIAVILGAVSSGITFAQPAECGQPSLEGCPLPLEQPIQATLVDVENVHTWQIDLTAPGSLTVSLSNLSANYDVFVYAADGGEVGASTEQPAGSKVAYAALVPAGTYWAYVGSWSGEISDQPYTISASFAPEATPTPPPTPAPALPYVPSGLSWEANCGLTQVKMIVRDNGGNPVNGVKFQIRAGSYTATSNPTGLSGVYDAGRSDFFLRGEAVAATWHIWVVDDSGTPQSPDYAFQTNTENCNPGGGGHQVATITWTKVR